jgi:hypothetical protein
VSDPFGDEGGKDPAPPRPGGLGIGTGVVLALLASGPLLRLHPLVAVGAYVAMVPLLLVRDPFVRGVAIGVLIVGAAVALLVGTCVVLLRNVGG